MPRHTPVADIIGGVILCAFGLMLEGFGGSPALAADACANPASYYTPGSHLIGYAHQDVQTFLAVLASISANPPPPAVASAALIVAYVSDDPAADVTLHFFGADGCDTGLWTKIPVAVLHLIDKHMGTAA